MRIRIEGSDLPGRFDGAAGATPVGRSGADPLRFADVQVGVQRRAEVVDRVRADAAVAEWLVEVSSREVDGQLDVGGPYVHGRPGARFLYLSWGTVERTEFRMFRRAKLMFGDVPTSMLRAGHEHGTPLIARLGLTGADGSPRCARVRPPDVTWLLG